MSKNRQRSPKHRELTPVGQARYVQVPSRAAVTPVSGVISSKPGEVPPAELERQRRVIKRVRERVAAVRFAEKRAQVGREIRNIRFQQARQAGKEWSADQLEKDTGRLSRTKTTRFWGDDSLSHFNRPVTAADPLQRAPGALRQAVIRQAGMDAIHSSIAVKDDSGLLYFFVQRPHEILPPASSASGGKEEHRTFSWSANVPHNMTFGGIIDFDPSEATDREIKQRWDNARTFRELGSIKAESFTIAKEMLKADAVRNSAQAAEDIKRYREALLNFARAHKRGDEVAKDDHGKDASRLKQRILGSDYDSLMWLWFLRALERQPDPDNPRNTQYTGFKDIQHAPVQKEKYRGNRDPHYDERVFWGIGHTDWRQVMKALRIPTLHALKHYWFPAIYIDDEAAERYRLNLHPRDISMKLERARKIPGDIVGTTGGQLHSNRFGADREDGSNAIFIIGRVGDQDIGLVRADTYLARFDSPMKKSALVKDATGVHTKEYGPSRRFVHDPKRGPTIV